jgi:membrane protease YdiL (CAAX protease family)
MPGPGPFAAIAVLVATAGCLVAAALLVPAHATAPVVVLVPQALLVLVILLALLLGRWRPGECGMGGCTRRQLLTGLAAAPLLVGAALMAGKLVVWTLGDPPAAVLRIDDLIRQLRGQGGMALVLLLTAVLPGLVEEALLRGVVLTGLRRRLSAQAAVTVTAVAFAALHLSPWRFLPQLILGLAAGLLAVRTGSCWPGAVMHAAFNAMVVALSLAVPAQA